MTVVDHDYVSTGTATLVQTHTLQYPTIDDRPLHMAFSKRSGWGDGAGVPSMRESTTAWNAGDYDRAFDLLHDAISRGLDNADRAVAHSYLGQIHIIRGDLPEAIEHFLKCLVCPMRPHGEAWQSAMRLHYIYHELGRRREAESLRQFAARVNKSLGWAHTDRLERQVRELVSRHHSTGTHVHSYPRLVRNLLSSQVSIRQSAIRKARRMGNSGRLLGVIALELAIKLRANDSSVSFHSPGFSLFTSDAIDEARKQILLIAKDGMICKEAQAVGSLIGILVCTGEDTVQLMAVIQEVSGAGQVHEFQLVGTHLQAVSGYRNASAVTRILWGLWDRLIGSSHRYRWREV